jgi:hypothetical protein
MTRLKVKLWLKCRSQKFKRKVRVMEKGEQMFEPVNPQI